MSTKVYGASDDLVEIDGDFTEEFGAYDREENDPKIVAMSDGTVLACFYPKNQGLGVWGIKVLNAGPLFDRLEVCLDEGANPHSDVAHFKDGITGACEHANGSGVDLRKERIIPCPHCDENIQIKTCACCGLLVGERT